MWGLRAMMPKRSFWRIAQFDTLRIARRSGMEERGDQASNLLSRPDDDCRATTQMQALC
jgi:hypothetical protein